MTTARQTNLADVADVELGKSPPQDSIRPLSVGVPLIARPSELGHRTPVPEASTTAPARIAQTGDLITSVRGAKLGVTNIADSDYAVGRGAVIVRPVERASSSFLFHALNASRPELERLAAGQAVPSILLDDLNSLRILWPAARDQVVIVERLELLHEYMARTAAYAGRATTIAEATYSLLCNGGGALHGPRVALGELVTEISERISPDDVAGELVTHYTHDQLRRQGDPEVVPGSSLGSPRKRIPAGSLLLSLIHPARWTAGRAKRDHGQLGLGSPEFLVMEAPDEVMATYLHAVLRFDPQFREEIQAQAHASIPGRERTRPKDALRAQVTLPHPEQFRLFADRFKAIFDLEIASARRAETSTAVLGPARWLLLAQHSAPEGESAWLAV